MVTVIRYQVRSEEGFSESCMPPTNNCDPECLLQSPETSKFPKVVRRGCNRCSGVCEPKACSTGAKEGCTGAQQGCTGARDSWQLAKTPFAPSPNHFGDFPGLCSRHSGWQTNNGPYPQYVWNFPEEIPGKFRKDPGNALRAFPEIPLKSTAGMPQTL